MKFLEIIAVVALYIGACVASGIVVGHVGSKILWRAIMKKVKEYEET